MSTKSRAPSQATAPTRSPAAQAPAPVVDGANSEQSTGGDLGSGTPMLDAFGLTNEALGNEEHFEAGKHPHRMWFEARDGGEVEAMVASSPVEAGKELTRLVGVIEDSDLLGDEWKGWARALAQEGLALIETEEQDTARKLGKALKDDVESVEMAQERLSTVKPAYRLAYVFKELFEAEYNATEMKKEPNAMHAVTFFQERMYAVFGDLGVYETDLDSDIGDLLSEFDDNEVAPNQMPHMLGVVMDEELDQAFFGMSAGSHAEENRYRQETMHPSLDSAVNQLDHATEPWDISNCSEFEAANESRWQRSLQKDEDPGTTSVPLTFWDERVDQEVMDLAKDREKKGSHEAEKSLRNPRFKPKKTDDPFKDMRFAAAESKPDKGETKRRDPCLNCDRLYHAHGQSKITETKSSTYESSRYNLENLTGTRVRAVSEAILKLIPESYKGDAVGFLAGQADSSAKLSERDKAINKELGRHLKGDMAKLVDILKGA